MPGRREGERARAKRRGGAGIRVAVGGALLLALSVCYLALLGGGAPPPGARGEFALVDGDGRHVTENSYPGRFKLIFFGYSRCPDQCPLALSAVSDALALLGPLAARIQPLFITVDPRHDTPAVVKRYAAEFTPRLVGLTGSPAQIRAAAMRYGVSYQPDASSATPVDHDAVLLLVDPQGRLVAPLAASLTGRQLASVLRSYLRASA